MEDIVISALWYPHLNTNIRNKLRGLDFTHKPIEESFDTLYPNTAEDPIIEWSDKAEIKNFNKVKAVIVQDELSTDLVRS